MSGIITVWKLKNFETVSPTIEFHWSENGAIIFTFITHSERSYETVKQRKCNVFSLLFRTWLYSKVIKVSVAGSGHEVQQPLAVPRRSVGSITSPLAYYKKKRKYYLVEANNGRVI